MVQILNTPLDVGKELQVANLVVTEAYSQAYDFACDSEAILVSLFVDTTAGDVDVKVYTQGEKGHTLEVISFPTVSAPTSELLIKKTAVALRRIRVVVTTTDAAEFEIRARGISNGISSVKIEGSSDADNYGILVDTTPRLLLPVALTDQNGVSVRNNSTSGILYVGFKSTITAANTAVVGVADLNAAMPIVPGASMGIDIQAGVTLYGVSDGPDLDIRIMQLGG
jgi:hypothetical protein